MLFFLKEFKEIVNYINVGRQLPPNVALPLSLPYNYFVCSIFLTFSLVIQNLGFKWVWQQHPNSCFCVSSDSERAQCEAVVISFRCLNTSVQARVSLWDFQTPEGF